MLDNIQIAMLEISAQSKAVIEFYFNSVGKNLYTVVAKDKADAFIADYDYPGAKDHVAEILSTENKPVIILSIKEQELPSTIWLAKPLTADSLTKAADKLQQMITANAAAEVVAVKTLTAEPLTTEALITETVTTEALTTETQTVKTNSKEVVATIETPMPEEESGLNDSSNIFNLLDNETEELDENHKIEAILAMVGTSALVSATKSANEKTDLADLTDTAKNTKSKEDSYLEFSKILLDDENNPSLSKESEGEIDALLEALILGEGSKEQDITTDISTESDENDISLDGLSLGDESGINAAVTNKIEDSVDLLAVGITVEKDSSIVIEEKEGLLADENFTLINDLNASEEDIYANTLEVDYADIKAETTEALANIDQQLKPKELELESHDKSSQKEKHSDTTIEDTLETDLFSFDLESTDDTEELDNVLEEVSVETDTIDDISQKAIDMSSITNDTSSIEKDFDSKEKTDAENKNSAEFDLQSLLNEVREEASTNQDNDGFGDNAGNTSPFDQTQDEKRLIQLCGNYKSVKSQKDVANISFTLNNHLLKTLLDQIKSIKGSEQVYRLKYHDLIIVLDDSQNSIYCNLPLTNDEYSDICFSEIEHKNIKIHDLDYSEIRLYRKKIDENPDRAHTIESFIWSTSLLTSRGRLPDDTDVTKKVGLKIWPNLTRVELTPHAMHVAAVLNKNPANLLEISDWINVEQRYVFAFYNAALSLGILEIDSSKLKKSAFNFSNKNSNKKSEERSFFSRLLKRLK